jgi:SpoVK/Ycf46/Vps4 family AAA+-type ATPase
VSYAALDGRTAVTLADVQQASRAANRQTLDALAACVPTSGGWDHLVVNDQTLAELANLESRCRHRERLPVAVGAALGAQLNAGVRALFSGPSGTGKSLAARLLAAELQMDLYRVDLSTVVNKYIGETEKNLSQIFARAEELGIILLFDEGDALLTQRTDVQTANDRYANLETNYLLQRLEAFEGIVIVTTNAGERIDSAFERRIDVVVTFRPPEAAERWSIWHLHLPATHAIDDALLREVAGRCTLTGGQIRNAVLQASLLALDDGQIITSAHLEAAVQREYRKSGAVCPLRRTTAMTNHRR